jgi:hypothetical protein
MLAEETEVSGENQVVDKPYCLSPFTCSQNLFDYLPFKSFDFKRTWWRLYQKRVVRIKLDIYVFIIYKRILKVLGASKRT